jgi:hypothetical protein
MGAQWVKEARRGGDLFEALGKRFVSHKAVLHNATAGLGAIGTYAAGHLFLK